MSDTPMTREQAWETLRGRVFRRIPVAPSGQYEQETDDIIAFLRTEMERLEGERDQAKDMLVGNALWAKTMQRNRELEAALERIAWHELTWKEARDVARAALPDTEGEQDG